MENEVQSLTILLGSFSIVITNYRKHKFKHYIYLFYMSERVHVHTKVEVYSSINTHTVDKVT